MHSTIAVLLTLLATAISAAPASTITQTQATTVTVQLANDQSGANANVPIVANGSPNPVASLFKGTNLNKNGQFLATSFQLVQFVAGTTCSITSGSGSIVGTVNTDKTFTFLNGNVNAAVLTDVSADNIQCTVKA